MRRTHGGRGNGRSPTAIARGSKTRHTRQESELTRPFLVGLQMSVDHSLSSLPPSTWLRGVFGYPKPTKLTQTSWRLGLASALPPKKASPKIARRRYIFDDGRVKCVGHRRCFGSCIYRHAFTRTHTRTHTHTLTHTYMRNTEIFTMNRTRWARPLEDQPLAEERLQARGRGRSS